MFRLILSMGGNSLRNELMEHFSYDVKAATASSFVQQRDKIIPAAFEFLMHQFTASFPDYKTFDGYRLLAVDGSDLGIAHNPDDSDTYFQSSPEIKGFNLLHLNARYDLCNHLYVDAVVQPRRKANERRALTDMVDRSDLDDSLPFFPQHNIREKVECFPDGNVSCGTFGYNHMDVGIPLKAAAESMERTDDTRSKGFTYD